MTDTSLLDAALAKVKSPPLAPFILGETKPKKPEPLPLFELTREAIDAATIEERDAIIADLKEWGMLHLPFPAIVIRFPEEAVANVLAFEPQPQLRNVWVTMMVTENDKTPMIVKPVYTVSKMRKDENRGSFTLEEIEAQVTAGGTNERTCVMPSGIGPNMFYENGDGRWINLDDPWIGAAPEVTDTVKADYNSLICEATTILLASLAAKNVIKDVRFNARTAADKPCFKGRDGVTYLSRTVVRPPCTSEMDGPHEQSKPHLRRGHVHTVIADTTKPQPQRPDIRVTVVGAGREGRRQQWFAPTYVNVDKGFIAAPHYKVQ